MHPMVAVAEGLKGRHFTKVADWSRDDLLTVLDLADRLKDAPVEDQRLLPGRTLAQADVEELAAHASVPVINGLTDDAHPCQALADVMTIRERFGRLEGVRVAYLGDGNNVCGSLMVACGKLGMPFVAATPPGYRPDEQAVQIAREAGGSVELT